MKYTYIFCNESSPNRNYDNHGCNVYQSGVVDVDYYVYWDSCGRFELSGIT